MVEVEEAVAMVPANLVVVEVWMMMQCRACMDLAPVEMAARVGRVVEELLMKPENVAEADQQLDPGSAVEEDQESTSGTEIIYGDLDVVLVVRQALVSEVSHCDMEILSDFDCGCDSRNERCGIFFFSFVDFCFENDFEIYSCYRNSSILIACF